LEGAIFWRESYFGGSHILEGVNILEACMIWKERTSHRSWKARVDECCIQQYRAVPAPNRCSKMLLAATARCPVTGKCTKTTIPAVADRRRDSDELGTHEAPLAFCCLVKQLSSQSGTSLSGQMHELPHRRILAQVQPSHGDAHRCWIVPQPCNHSWELLSSSAHKGIMQRCKTGATCT